MKPKLFFLATIVLLLCACDSSQNGRLVGQLESDRIELTADISEPITEILVQEGDAVSPGQLLMRQDTSRAEARLAESRASVALAQGRLDELIRGPRQEQIEVARARLEAANKDQAFRMAEFERIDEIHTQGLASDEELDQARLALDSALANRDIAQAELEERLAGTTVEEIRQAEASLAEAVARLDLAQVDLDRHEIRAPVEGVLDSRLFEIGERPNVGQPIMIMLGEKQPYARVYIAEEARVGVRAGDSARVYVDGLEQAIDGRVRWVASEAAFTPYFALTERDRGRLSYLAKIDIQGLSKRLPDGIPVEVELDSGAFLD